ncbi:hypothetical protein BGZ58_009502 [Dissophora ornata]|nr:hypothetical protein BGZ58_009502 [Dissophora ornata]
MATTPSCVIVTPQETLYRSQAYKVEMSGCSGSGPIRLRYGNPMNLSQDKVPACAFLNLAAGSCMFTPMRAGEGFSFSAIDASGAETFSGPFMVADVPGGAARPVMASVEPMEVAVKPAEAAMESGKAEMKSVESAMRPIEAETKQIRPEAKSTAMKTAGEVAENKNNMALPMSGWMAVMHSDEEGPAVVMRKKALYDVARFRAM